MTHSLLRATLALLLATAAPVAAVHAAPATAATQADAALTAFFDRYDAAVLARSPQAKAMRGIRDDDYGRWDDLSDAAADAAIAEDAAFLAEMQRTFAHAPLSADSRLSYRLFERQVQRRADAARFRHLNLLFDQMRGLQSGLPAFLINMHRVDNLAEAEAYVSRLEGMGPLLDQAIAISAERAGKAVAAPAWVYAHVINDARGLLKGAPFEAGADSSLLADFRAKVGKLQLPAADSARLIAAAESALRDSVGPAYQRLIAAMEAQAKLARPTDGISSLPDSAAFYAERLKFHTTTDLTAAQIHDLGLQEVARIQGEMVALMPQLGVSGDLQALFAHVRSSDSLFFPNTDEGRAAYLAQAETAIAAMSKRLPEAFSTLPKAPLQVKRVEAFREGSAGKAFYSSPAPDGSRPGIYYANLYNMREMPRYELEALAFHEGLPGHHLQLSIQTELDLPPFRRFGGFTAYSEGWGLYAEQLPKEMGFYQDPWQDFGRLKMDLWRAIRLVADTGLHHKGWSREQTIQYHLDNSPSDRAEITRAVERYAIMPGQATAYAIGKLELLRLREETRQRLGDRFDIQGFHDAVLRPGPLPLDLLAEEVRGWEPPAR